MLAMFWPILLCIGEAKCTREKMAYITSIKHAVFNQTIFVHGSSQNMLCKHLTLPSNNYPNLPSSCGGIIRCKWCAGFLIKKSTMDVDYASCWIVGTTVCKCWMDDILGYIMYTPCASFYVPIKWRNKIIVDCCLHYSMERKQRTTKLNK